MATITYSDVSRAGGINYVDDANYSALGSFKYIESTGVISLISLTFKYGEVAFGSATVKGGGDEYKINIANVPNSALADIVTLIQNITTDVEGKIASGEITNSDDTGEGEDIDEDE